MVSIPLKLRIEVKQQDLLDWIYAQRRFQPVTFGYRAEHSEYVEYGTGPARGREKFWVGDAGRKALDDWARIKVGMYNDKERRKFVNALAWKIHQYGMKPQPYWRPAINQVWINLQSYYDAGYSLEDIGNEVHRLSDNFIITNHIPFQGNIQRSWYIDTIPVKSALEQTNIIRDLETNRALAEEMQTW